MGEKTCDFGEKKNTRLKIVNLDVLHAMQFSL